MASGLLGRRVGVLITYDKSRPRNVTSAWALAAVVLCAGSFGGVLVDVAGAAASAGVCPVKLGASVAPSKAPGSQRELVPPGAVSVTVCRYRGLNDPSARDVGRLAGSAVLSDLQRVQSLSARFDGLPPAQGGPVACPADDGSMALAIFGYPGSAFDPVSIRLTGCSIASNGFVVGNMAFDVGWRLRVELQRLTGCDVPPCDSDPVVPRVVGLDVAAAYRRLHRAGLRVSLPAVELNHGGLASPLHVVAQSVRAGKAVASDGIVQLTLGCPRCGVTSPAVPVTLPVYRVPGFVGKSVAAARRWVAGKTLYFVVHLGPLVGGDARDLFDNYRVSRQQPRVRSWLSLGRRRSCCGGTGGSFRPTPLAVWGAQIG
jgi:PASTA domain